MYDGFKEFGMFMPFHALGVEDSISYFLFAIIIIILPLCHYYHYYIYAFYLLLYLLLSISLANPLQVAHMAFFKRILRVKSTSANWCVL